MSRPTGFEIQATDSACAMRFHAGLRGWTVAGVGDDNWLIHACEPQTHGIEVGLMPRHWPAPDDGQPGGAHPCVVSVDDLDDTAAKVPGPGAARSPCRRSRSRASAGARTRATRDATGSA
jgi:predicted enzyme related to lactoylglutathione lyase